MTETPAIEALEVARSFGGVRALTDGSLTARFGEVHALVGENGAGKSTLIKILGGVVKPEGGTIRIAGEDVTQGIAAAARRHGVGTVFQELTLFPWMTVAENLFVGTEPRGRTSRLIQRRKLAGRAQEVLDRFEVDGIDPRALSGSLPLAQRQILEIVCAFMREPRILFLDEPTSALGERDVAWLFGLVRRLRDDGACVLFTSHRWSEVASLADRITILRNGAHVATREHFAEDEAVTLMTGRTIDRMYPDKPVVAEDAQVVLETEELGDDLLDGVSFKLRRGEILGVGGLAGQGQPELFMSLFGARRSLRGRVLVRGKRARLRRPKDAIRHGMAIALVPEDRKTEGLMLPMSVRDNLTLAVLDSVSTGGVIRARREKATVATAIERLRIKTRDPATQQVGTLSGGNQQKVLIGRWLLTQPDVLLLFDITRGVDVGTKHDIYELVVQLAAEGKALLYYSSETEEIAQLCNRVLVMREGRVVAELDGADTDAEAIVAAAVREGPA
jgi:ribose transport system ATP-binding protein